MRRAFSRSGRPRDCISRMRLRSTDCAFASGADTAGVEGCRRRVLLNSEAGRGYRFSKGGEDDCGGGEDGDGDVVAPCAPKLKLCKSFLDESVSVLAFVGLADIAVGALWAESSVAGWCVSSHGW
jgi:hypothetical protein